MISNEDVKEIHKLFESSNLTHQDIVSMFLVRESNDIVEEPDSLFVKVYDYTKSQCDHNEKLDDVRKDIENFIKVLQRKLGVTSDLNIDLDLSDSVCVIAFKYTFLLYMLKKASDKDLLYKALYIFLVNSKYASLSIKQKISNWVLKKLGLEELVF